MKLQLDQNNLVIAYAVTGGLNGNVVELEQYGFIINEETGGKSKR